MKRVKVSGVSRTGYAALSGQTKTRGVRRAGRKYAAPGTRAFYTMAKLRQHGYSEASARKEIEAFERNETTSREADKKAQKAFASAYAKTKKLVAKVALGDDDRKAGARAFDRLEKLASTLRDERSASVLISDLRQSWRLAIEIGTSARQAARDAEVKEAMRKHRESLPRPGSYEAELMISANRYRKR